MPRQSEKTIGKLCDELYRARERRLKAQRELKKLREAERKLEDQILSFFGSHDTTRVSGTIANASLKKGKPVPVLKNWDKFFAFAKLKGNQDLLSHDVRTEAWRDRRARNIVVPGTQAFIKTSMSLTRRAGR